MPKHPTYWLLDWLETNKIKTIAQAEAALTGPAVLGNLREAAEQWSTSVAIEALPGVNLVAGTGLRLDELLTCPSPRCRQQQIDVLFRHAWHYFDRVLLSDGVGDLLVHPPHGWNSDYLLKVLLGMIESTLYIQRLGASDLVQYYPSVRHSPWKLADLLGEGQQKQWADGWGMAEATLAAEGDYHFERLGPRRFKVECLDPYLGTVSQFELELGEEASDSKKSLRTKTAHSIMHQHISYLEEDLRARHVLRGALGSAVWSHERVLSHIRTMPEAPEILFHLSLPSLAHVPVRELISVRAAEGDSFAAFRSALSKAAREMVTSKGVTNPKEAAAAIVSDIIEPELARVRQRLRAAQHTLARKTAVSVVLSAITTTCGLLLGAGPLVAGGAGMGTLISGTGTAASKYLDEKQFIEMADMFFLWKALGHAE